MESNEELLRDLHKIGLSELEKEVVFITDEPKIPYFLCFPNKTAIEKYDSKSCFGQGHHLNKTIARIKAVAELLERLCLDNPKKKALQDSFYYKNNDFADPSLFLCYSREQVPNQKEFKQQTRNEKYLWYPVKELVTGKQMKIPAQFIFLSPIFNKEFQIKEERISTGAALGKKGTDRAIISGFLEVIERDACISSYLMKKNIPQIIGMPEDIKDLKKYLKRYNLESYVFDATSDIRIPTIISITLDRTGIGPAVEVGSASSFNYKEAIYKALLESIQCRRSARLFNDEIFSNGFPKQNEIFSLESRFLYWQNPERIKDIEFWVTNKKKVHYSDLNTEIRDLGSAIEIMKERGYHVFVAEITLPEIEKEKFEVLKVIIPEMHPLYLDERAKALFSIHYGNIKDDPSLKPHPLT